MASMEQYDRYAAELTGRFEELEKWAIANWPKEDVPLLHSDFDASRREISQIVGPKLGDPDGGDGTNAQAGDQISGAGVSRNEPDFRDVTPMPWP